MPDRYAVDLERDVVSASGPEATSFLQGQLSQDVAGIGEGSSAWSWLLAPNGKVDALVRVSLVAPDEWVIDTDGGWGEAVLARLNRFKLRTKVEIQAVPWKVLGLRGEGWDVTGPEWAGVVRAVVVPAIVVPAWPGVAGTDVLGPDVRGPDVRGPDVLGSGVEPPSRARGGSSEGPARIGLDAYEPRRILAGIPRMGAELTEKTIPGETGLIDMTVSFTKGCYTGQELVARIDSRGGNVPRHLRSLRLEEAVAPGVQLFDGEQAVGVVTSEAFSADEGWVGMGYVRRGLEPPMRLQAGSGGPSVEVGDLPR